MSIIVYHRCVSHQDLCSNGGGSTAAGGGNTVLPSPNTSLSRQLASGKQDKSEGNVWSRLASSGASSSTDPDNRYMYIRIYTLYLHFYLCVLRIPIKC